MKPARLLTMGVLCFLGSCGPNLAPPAHPGSGSSAAPAEVKAKIALMAPVSAAQADAALRRFHEAGAASNWTYGPSLKKAYIESIRAKTLAECSTRQLLLPQAFLDWIDGDPQVQAAVYCSRKDPLPVLIGLRSLEIDLGEQIVRKDYTQLALATAINGSYRGWQSTPQSQNDSRNLKGEPALADISPRPLLKLEIPGDPRVRIDTKDPKRQLDLNDHIINFLEDHADIEVETLVRELPPLEYDERGVAKPQKKAVDVKKMIRRKPYAADVLASRVLQEEFNSYMKAHGQTISIDAGDKVVHWHSHAGVEKTMRKKIASAFELFRDAYRAKGRLPQSRDRAATPAENMAWLIRNDRHVFTAEEQKSRKWPRFPLNAPWPVLMMLADDDQPLREREEIWIKFRDKGEMRTYGEYIGAIAQQFDMQSARRLTPFPYYYGSIEMMWKDGGVCGTMGAIGSRTNRICGIPSTTAGQPGHCALVMMTHDPKTGLFACKGGQYATGGDEVTTVHYNWNFDETTGRRGMVYHQSIAWAVNQGLDSYLDSLALLQIVRNLPEDPLNSRALSLLEKGLAVHPYSFALVDAAQSRALDAATHFRLYDSLAASLDALAAKPDAPKTALYRKRLRSLLFSKLEKLPLPQEKSALAAQLARLEKDGCDHPSLLCRYWVALEGESGLLKRSGEAVANYLAGPRTDTAARIMNSQIKAWTAALSSKSSRSQWAAAQLKAFSGKELYIEKNKLFVDPSVSLLAKTAGVKSPSAVQMHSALAQSLELRLQASVKAPRTEKACKDLASDIRTLGAAITDAALRAGWKARLEALIKGQEIFVAGNGRKARKITDPCVAAIQSIP